MLVRDASERARKLYPKKPQAPPNCGGLQFYHPNGVGVGKAHLLLSRSSTSSLVSGQTYSTLQKGGPQTLALGLNMNAGLIPSPTQGPEAILKAPLMKQACLVLMVFLSNLLTYSDPPMSPKFPSLNMILYRDFCNHLCLLHPYQGLPHQKTQMV